MILPGGGDGCLTDWNVRSIKYGHYRLGCYVIESYDGAECVLVDDEKYQLLKEQEKNQNFVAEFQSFIFDSDLSADQKVRRLQGLFPQRVEGDEPVSLSELITNFDLSCGKSFVDARQRAIQSGFKP